MTSKISIGSKKCIGCSAESTKPLSRVERTKSFLKTSLMKRWKSSKELFSSLTGNDNERKMVEIKYQNSKFINEKVLENLDEFERNFLLSAGRKFLVRELRKNFEKPHKDISITVDVSQTKEKASNFVSEKTKKFANASVRTVSNYDHISYETKTIMPNQNQKKQPLVMRHSFYNTYRNGYCAWQNNHYASNLSLISYGDPSSSKTCLEKTINKYKHSIKSSSAVDLSSISSVMLNTSVPSIVQSIKKPSSNLGQQYSSIINISHSNSTGILTDSPIIDYSYDSIGTSVRTCAIVDNQIQRKSHLQSRHSMKSLNKVSSAVCHETSNVKIDFRNGEYDTNSLIATSSSSVMCDNAQNNNIPGSHSNSYVSTTKLHGSNLTLNNINNNNINYEHNSLPNCHNNNRINNGNIAEINISDNNHDGNNNKTIKVRKSYSINQIDLNLLKNELDEYIDRDLRTTNLGRRQQFESSSKKVKIITELMLSIFPNSSLQLKMKNSLWNVNRIFGLLFTHL